MTEMPLIIFTLCEDLAVGAMIALVVLELMGKKKFDQTNFKISGIALIVAVVGMIASLFHLGQPLRAVNVLFGLGSSWLSREIVFFGLFVVLVLVYVLLAKKGTNEGAIKGVGIAAAAVGLIALICTILCYMLPGVVSWNNALTPIMFIVAAAAMGISFVFALTKAAEKANDAKMWRNIFIAVVVVCAVWRFLFYSNITLLVFSM